MIPRRTIEELLASYALEPSLRDLFVEGSSDRDFFRWFLNEQGYGHVPVYKIDAIEVPPELEIKYNLTDGNRQRVIALALELSQAVAQPNASCIVDLDFDLVFPTLPACNLLYRTDGTTLEVYLYHRDLLAKFLRLVIGDENAEIKARSMMEKLQQPLEELFLLKAAEMKLGLNLTWPANFKLWRKGRYTLDKFMEQVLINNRLTDRREELKKAYDELYSQFHKEELGKRIHGKDFIALLSDVLGNNYYNSAPFKNLDHLFRSLLGAMELKFLGGFKLFNDICDVLRTGKAA